MKNAELTKIVQEVVLEGRMPAKAVALEIGKPYPTLMRELNSYDEGAKLGAETLLEIMRITGNVEPLLQMARELGYALVEERRSVREALVSPLEAGGYLMRKGEKELQAAM